jgi:hypothetical protein
MVARTFTATVFVISALGLVACSSPNLQMRPQPMPESWVTTVVDDSEPIFSTADLIRDIRVPERPSDLARREAAAAAEPQSEAPVADNPAAG